MLFCSWISPLQLSTKKARLLADWGQVRFLDFINPFIRYVPNKVAVMRWLVKLLSYSAYTWLVSFNDSKRPVIWIYRESAGRVPLTRPYLCIQWALHSMSSWFFLLDYYNSFLYPWYTLSKITSVIVSLANSFIFIASWVPISLLFSPYLCLTIVAVP